MTGFFVLALVLLVGLYINKVFLKRLIIIFLKDQEGSEDLKNFDIKKYIKEQFKTQSYQFFCYCHYLYKLRFYSFIKINVESYWLRKFIKLIIIKRFSYKLKWLK